MALPTELPVRDVAMLPLIVRLEYLLCAGAERRRRLPRHANGVQRKCLGGGGELVRYSCAGAVLGRGRQGHLLRFARLKGTLTQSLGLPDICLGMILL